MFERFTDSARHVIHEAQEEARRFDHNYIGSEHLLAALVQEAESIAGQALAMNRVTNENVHQQIGEIIGRGNQPPQGHIPFTPRLKGILELSLREALSFGHNYIGTEHLLLGLMNEAARHPERSTTGADILQKLEVDPRALRNTIIQLLAVEGEAIQREQQAASEKRQAAHRSPAQTQNELEAERYRELIAELESHIAALAKMGRRAARSKTERQQIGVDVNGAVAKLRRARQRAMAALERLQ